MILFDYSCIDHGMFEAWGSAGASAPCPTCSRKCKPIPGGGHFSLEGISGHFPTAAEKWARRHERHEEPGREI